MTIDEIIEELEESKDYPASDPASDEALNGAINIMRKYQRIEQIMNKAQTSWGVIQDTWLYKDIREVLEDGNSDMDHSNL